MMTVAVCFLTAGIMRDVGEEGGMVRNVLWGQEEIVGFLNGRDTCPGTVYVPSAQVNADVILARSLITRRHGNQGSTTILPRPLQETTSPLHQCA